MPQTRHQQAYPAIIQRYRQNPFFNDWTQVLLQGERHHGVTERKEWMNYGRERNHYTARPSYMQMFTQLMEGTLKKLERYCSTARPMLGGEVYLTGEEVCSLLRLSTRTLQDYRDNGTIAYCKIGGKILYKQSDIQAMLERHYYPISKKQGWQNKTCRRKSQPKWRV